MNFCTECGTKLSSSFKFCPNCGLSIENLNKKVQPTSDQKLSVPDFPEGSYSPNYTSPVYEFNPPEFETKLSFSSQDNLGGPDSPPAPPMDDLSFSGGKKSTNRIVLDANSTYNDHGMLFADIRNHKKIVKLKKVKRSNRNDFGGANSNINQRHNMNSNIHAPNLHFKIKSSINKRRDVVVPKRRIIRTGNEKKGRGGLMNDIRNKNVKSRLRKVRENEKYYSKGGVYDTYNNSNSRKERNNNVNFPQLTFEDRRKFGKMYNKKELKENYSDFKTFTTTKNQNISFPNSVKRPNKKKKGCIIQ